MRGVAERVFPLAASRTGRAVSYWRAARHAWHMVNPWSPVVRDDRGRKVPLYRLDRGWMRMDGRSDVPPKAFGRIRSRLLRETRYGMGGRPSILIGLVVLYSAIASWSLWMGAPGFVVWPYVGMIGLLAIGAVTYRTRLPKVERETMVHAMLEECLCASCAYDLSRVRTDGKGLVTCPECGAAWIIPQAELPVASHGSDS